MTTHEIGPPDINLSTALFLDVDGTLLEFAPRPDAVYVPPGLPALLQALMEALGGALAVVSGRTISSVDRLLRPVLLPAAGQHGAEWRLRADGPIVARVETAGMDELRLALERLADAGQDIFLERKPFSVTVHYRGAAGELLRRIGDAIAEAGVAGWEILTAHQAFEVKRSGVDKGLAIGRFLEETPFRGRRPVFLGDDLTDEYGFAAVLAAGGEAVRVGPDERPSYARARLSGPSQVLEWLAGQLSMLRTVEDKLAIF